MIPVLFDAELDLMLTYPEIDPVIFSIFGLKIRWYGLMYVLGFLAAWWLARSRHRWRFIIEALVALQAKAQAAAIAARLEDKNPIVLAIMVGGLIPAAELLARLRALVRRGSGLADP